LAALEQKITLGDRVFPADLLIDYKCGHLTTLAQAELDNRSDSDRLSSGGLSLRRCSAPF
jgi:hypothetical protein